MAGREGQEGREGREGREAASQVFKGGISAITQTSLDLVEQKLGF